MNISKRRNYRLIDQSPNRYLLQISVNKRNTNIKQIILQLIFENRSNIIAKIWYAITICMKTMVDMSTFINNSKALRIAKEFR